MDSDALHSLVACVGDGLVAADAQGRYVLFNPAAERLLGKGPPQGPPETWAAHFGFFYPDEVTPLPPSALPLVRALAGQQTDDLQLFVRNEGVPEGRHLSATGRPWRDGHGVLRGGVSVFHDIQEKRKAEVELRRAHAFLDSIIEHVAAMIFVKDARNLRFERFNRAGEELLGMPRERLLGKTDYDLFPREQADFFTQRDRETLSGRAVVDVPEEPIDTAHGRRWLSTRKVPVLDARGQPEYLLGISVDITELKRAHEGLEQRVQERTAELQKVNEELRREITDRQRAEEALRRSEEQLRQSQKMEAVGRLAGGVAHDFNNMLTAILSYARLISADLPIESSAQADLEQIVLAGERAAALIRQLLAFSRKQVLAPEVLDVSQVVHGMESMLQRLIGEDVELKVIRDAPGCSVLADATQIEQVLLNLSINARDAMPTGGRLTIQVSRLDLKVGEALPGLSLQPGQWVVLTVTDTGTGMTDETKARVFEPFFTTKARGKGTGLGAATVFGIVKQSGGEVVVDSELGVGTVFKIYLPRVDGVKAPAAPAPEGSRGQLHATVLVVEDEPLVRAAALKILRSHGLQALEAGSPDQALSVCLSHPGAIDLLLTDVVLPSLNGRQLAERVSQLRPSVRVLFMSGYADDAFPDQAALVAGRVFLPKPFTPEGLIKKVREVLESGLGLGLGQPSPRPAPPRGEGV